MSRDVSHFAPLDRLHPRRILVLRAVPPDELLYAAPALRALRHKLPAAEIVLLGLPAARHSARQMHQCVDRFLDFPGFDALMGNVRLAAEVAGLLAELRTQPFDLAIQMHGCGTLANFVLPLLGAAHMAGFCRAGEYCPEPDLFLPYPYDLPDAVRLLRLMEFLGAAGAETAAAVSRPPYRQGVAGVNSDHS